MECPNKPTIGDLDELDRARKEKQDIINEEYNRVKRCFAHKICPCCGEPLKREDIEVLDKPKKYLFGLIVKKTKKWNERWVCTVDKAHFLMLILKT